MDKRYQPEKTEKEISALWEKSDCFTPKVDPKKEPFVITLPPPNVTGGLHAGHAMYTIEDIMARFNRMKGIPTLFLPGFDHASIAVEYLVSKQIRKKGKTKFDLGKEEFLKQAHQFADQSRDYIKKQLKLLGFSLDWSREAYTMSQDYSEAVKTAFNHLKERGLIYQGETIVNWCPDCQTVLSDLENEHLEKRGQLYYLKYGPVTIATTRPETMFADVAVAVHPDNKQYKSLIGQKIPLPLTKRKIPIITDETVDPEFGTGALKITPAHDELDFQIGKRHHLKTLIAIDKEGRLTKITGPFQGLTAQEARKRVIEKLEKQGLLVKTETITHSVGHCQRCGTTTEPQISLQWFVRTKPLAKRAIQAVKKGQIKIVPDHFAKIYFHWLGNIHDWCISRQLWWGHPIPVKGESAILDTWFSSSLWPMATLGWPKKTADFAYFYPNTIRETGYDIIFFWVAREIMMCLELTGKIPFKTVYLHGLVRDEKGRKFSKTKGIGFDPVETIAKNGADALRMALVLGNAPGADVSLPEEKVISMRNFTNKIWNATRFIIINQNNFNLKIKSPKLNLPSFGKNNEDDQKILKSLEETIDSVTNHIDNYRFGQAAEDIYGFFWHKFCDIYIEQAKDRLYDQDNPGGQQEALLVLLFVLKKSLKLLHPFMPFVTEEIWTNQLGEKTPLAISPWPKITVKNSKSKIKNPNRN
ncbi:MAG: valine--tRNA ligase [Candidatus Shapirobacteria bacterium]|nr:valine--tRNA ligase [Candidatus Shapirobacteria bacterium]